MLPPIRPSPIIPSVRFIAFRSIAARRGRSMVARCRDAHKGARGAHAVSGHALLQALPHYLADSCYNNRRMHHELANLHRPPPGAGA